MKRLNNWYNNTNDLFKLLFSIILASTVVIGIESTNNKFIKLLISFVLIGIVSIRMYYGFKLNKNEDD
jgi:hypothetical protein